MSKAQATQDLCDDLLAECRALDGFVSQLGDADWRAVTPFFGWTVRDQILHLHQVDRFGLISLADSDEFRELVAVIRAKQAEGLQLSELVRNEFAETGNLQVLNTWRDGYERIASELVAAPEGQRITWFGPEMGVLSFAAARLMEVWAHGQDIFDLFSEAREPTDRIGRICELGVRTFGWSFRNRGLDVPKRPSVMLVSPSGEEWSWHGESDESVRGHALDFALVVTQRRAPQDTDLVASGPVAKRWLDIAQCFAGAPQTPASPGSRPQI